MPILKNGDIARQSRCFDGPQRGNGVLRQAVGVSPQLPESVLQIGVHIVRVPENRGRIVRAADAINEREPVTATLREDEAVWTPVLAKGSQWAHWLSFHLHEKARGNISNLDHDAPDAVPFSLGESDIGSE